jgi:anti-sigma factor RsiW
MKCREFNEIADTYLSDELLVETNHDVQRHLESCSDCRLVLAERRELRAQVRAAVRRHAVMSPALAASIRKDLAGKARREKRWFPIPALAFAALTLSAALGLALYLNADRGDQDKTLTASVAADFWSSIIAEAAANHRDCGISHAAVTAKTDAVEEDYLTVKANFSAAAEFLEEHECYHKGRKFHHVVMRDRGRIISILRAESGATDSSKTISSAPAAGYQVSGFTSSQRVVFVVSDLPEQENMQIARVVSKKYGV